MHPIIEHPVAYDAAIERNIKNNARKTRFAKFQAENEDWEALVDYVDQNSRNAFWSKIFGQYMEWGNIHPKICVIIRERMTADEKKIADRKAEYAARDAASNYVGKIGQRIDVEVVCYFTAMFEGFYGTGYVCGFRDIDDNIFIYKGSVCPEKNVRYLMRATVKEHSERDGAKQTIVSRPKLTLLDS